jgi:hypothetical protein
MYKLLDARAVALHTLYAHMLSVIVPEKIQLLTVIVWNREREREIA